MAATFNMYGWRFCIFQKSLAFAFPFAFCIFKTDGAYIRSCINDGSFMSFSDNGTWNCISCTECPEGFRITQPCRHNSDTVCEKCPPDTYVAEAGYKCRPCTICPPGQYIEKYCHGNQDRKCKTCMKGYYSRHWNALSCRRCKHCRQRESVVELCNGRNNSICGDCEKGYYRESSTLECVPCSKCQGEDYVTVRECIRKLGENSQFICQLRAYMYREKESQTSAVESLKVADPRASRIDVLTITLSALLVVVGFVLLSFAIAVILRYSHIFPSRRWRNARTGSRMLSSLYLEMTSECPNNVNDKQEKFPPMTPPPAHFNAKEELSESLETDCGTISERDAIGYMQEPSSSVTDQTEDTLSLLSCRVNPSPRVHRKHKKRRLRHEKWQSDSDIVTENRYAVLDAAKFTTM